MRRTGPWLLALFVWFVAVPVEAGEETLVSSPTRDGVVQSFLLREAHAPAGVVVLLAGGHGRLGLADGQHGVDMDGGHDNFLARSRALFAAHGYTAILVDVPSDRQGEEGMFGGFRGEEAHASDLGIVLDWVEGRYGLPVWLVGTSRGTESVAAFARRAGTRIEGLVLSAPVTRTTRRGVSLLEYPWSTSTCLC